VTIPHHRLVVAAAGALFFVPAETVAQSFWLKPRLSLSAGLSTYSGNADVAGAGVLGRLAVRFEEPNRPVSVQLEGAYHRFRVITQACPACPGCACSPQEPPEHVAAMRGGAQWHFSGVPRGLLRYRWPRRLRTSRSTR
jgi:hypothetical protein